MTKSKPRSRKTHIAERTSTLGVRPLEAVSGNGPTGVDVLKVLCHFVLSRWADRHGVTVDPVELASLFMDLGKDDTRRLDHALESITAAASSNRPRVAQQSARDSAQNEFAPTAGSGTAQVIIQAAAKTFLNRGYDVSLDEIAQAAGVTKPTIYSYFKGKKELFRAAMIGIADDMVPRIDPPSATGNLRAELLRYAQAFRAVILSERNLLAYRAALLHMRDVPDIGQIMGRKSMVRINRSLAAFFRQAIERGSIRPVDPELLSEYFFAATAGQARTKRLMGLDPDPPGREEQYLQQLVDCFLTGVATEKLDVALPEPVRAQRTSVKR
jgi:TetR/AcrR family transcriptional repressor of mexJK operon